MTLRRKIYHAWPRAFVFFAVFMAALPCLSAAETTSTDTQGLLPVPDYSVAASGRKVI